MLTLDDVQAAAILAGLRLLQRQGCPADLVEVATNFGRFGLPDDAFLDALCEQVNAGSGAISNWDTGEQDKDGLAVAPDTRRYTVTHPHATAAIRVEIECGALSGQGSDDTWIIDTELAEGRPVVRFYKPGQDEPAGAFAFVGVAALDLDGTPAPTEAA